MENAKVVQFHPQQPVPDPRQFAIPQEQNNAGKQQKVQFPAQGTEGELLSGHQQKGSDQRRCQQEHRRLLESNLGLYNLFLLGIDI